MAGYVPIATTLITGLFLLVGYFVQKHLERRQRLADKRREAYTEYFRAMFENMDHRRREEPDVLATEVYWKTQILLYASDAVLHLFGQLQDGLTPSGPLEGSEDDIRKAFDALLLAMRKETTGFTEASIEDVRSVSPLLD